MEKRIVVRTHIETTCSVLDPENGVVEDLRFRGRMQAPQLARIVRLRYKNETFTVLNIRHIKVVYTMPIEKFETLAERTEEEGF